MQRSLKVLSVLTTIILMFVLLGGALVTKTGSGQGCGSSWPLCNGQLVPNAFSLETLIELSHRLVSGTAGIFVTVLSVWSWRKLGHVREIRVLSVISFLFLMIQALFGAAAVVWAQSSFVLALHFGVSLISFAAVVQLTLLIFEVDKKFDAHAMRIDKKMRFHIYGITLYSYLVVYTGALVRHTHANFACPDFPLCTNKNNAFPSTLQEWVQMGHRAASFILVIWIIIALIHALRFYKDNMLIYWGWIIASILIALQAITGILNVYITTSEPIFLPLSHGFIISCLFSLFCYLSLLTSRSKK